jgi:hypothetical protein
MKKIKWTIMTLAICLSLGGALATAPQHDCRTDQQYFLSGSVYMPAGVFGQTFLCDAGLSPCTYTFDGVNYWPCRQGSYRIVNLTSTSPTPKPGKK